MCSQNMKFGSEIVKNINNVLPNVSPHTVLDQLTVAAPAPNQTIGSTVSQRPNNI